MSGDIRKILAREAAEAKMVARLMEAEDRAAEMEGRYDRVTLALRDKQATLDAYAQQNADVHRENMRLRDENSALREKLREG